MPNITDTLAADHRRCDVLFAAAEALIANENWEEGSAGFEDYENAMEHHFVMEEAVLFPAFEQRTGQTMGPTRVMRMEHAQMRDLFVRMKENIEGRDRDGYLGLSETLLVIMQQHNAKEQQMLYPMADQALGESVPEVISKMEIL